MQYLVSVLVLFQFSNSLCFCILAIKAEPQHDYHFNAYGCSDSPSLFGVTAHHLEQDGNLKAFNIPPSLYHLTAVEHRAHMLTPDPLDNQVYYESRAGTVINNPVFYSSCGTILVGGPQDASQSAASLSHYAPTGVPVAKQLDSNHEPLMLKQEGFVQKASPLGKSPPTGHVHDQADADGRGDQDQQPPEKQKGLRQAYLEDGEFQPQSPFTTIYSLTGVKKRGATIYFYFLFFSPLS